MQHEVTKNMWLGNLMVKQTFISLKNLLSSLNFQFVKLHKAQINKNLNIS